MGEKEALTGRVPAKDSLHWSRGQHIDSVRLIRLRKNGASSGFCTGSMELIHILSVSSGA
jgi:hypothetical protein